MADPFRNELEGAMARADRAEHEAARLRNELAIAKAPPVPGEPAARSGGAALTIGLVALAIGVGGAAYLMMARSAVEPIVEVAPRPQPVWSRASPVQTAVTALANLDDLECSPLLAANDPRAFMCRAHATAEQREKLTSSLGLTALHPLIDSPPNGCAILRPYMAPKQIERFSHPGAAALPRPSEAVVTLLYASPETNDVCLEIDFAEK